MYKKSQFLINLEAVGKELEAVRVARNENIKVAAKNLRMRPMALAKIERGETNFTYLTLIRICVYYKVNPLETLQQPFYDENI